MTIKGFFLGLLAAIFFAVALWWQYAAMEEKRSEPAGQVVLAWDVSSSYPRDCTVITERVLKAAIAGVPIKRGSFFTFVVTGGGDTSFEPKLVMNTAIPREGSSTGVLNVSLPGRKTRKQFMEAVSKACEGLQTVNSSAIYRTLEIALADLRGRCAKPADCTVIFGTDGEENVNPTVAAFLEGKRADAGVPLLDNSHAELIVCGYTASTGGRGPRNNGQAQLDRIKALFTDPGAVVLRPHCEDAIVTAPENASR